MTSQPISIMAAKILVLNPGLGKEMFPLSKKIVRILVENSSLVKFISDS